MPLRHAETKKKRRPAKSARSPHTVSQGLAPKRAAIYAVVKEIPRGVVLTYGQVAELAGIPRGHRVVATAMRTCPARLPWQRVVGKKDARRGKINIEDAEHARLQRKLLESEAVAFDSNGFIPFAAQAAPQPGSRPRRGKRRRRAA